MTKAKPYLDQNFQEIKERCLMEGTLFRDTKFSIDNPDNVFRFKRERNQEIFWKRPKDTFSQPKFLVNDANPNDLNQGDCWFLAASIAVSQYEDHFSFIVPKDQSFDSGDYCGAFHFRFWQYGQWYDVVVDDYLPFSKYTGNLAFAKNTKDIDELWCSLFEKAYAKLNQCYEFLNLGYTEDGLIDLTGGIDEIIWIGQIRDYDSLWRHFAKSFEFKSMMGASIVDFQIEGRRTDGLVTGHAYAVTNVCEIDKKSDLFNFSPKFKNFENKNDKIRLIRLRNPWGHTEWNGRYSDKSIEWEKITEEQKRKINFTSIEEGEFWMDFDDFTNIFTSLSFVHLDMNVKMLDNFLGSEEYSKWSCQNHHGIIQKNYSNDKNFNDQFLINLNKIKRDENKVTLIINFMQKDVIEIRKNNRGLPMFSTVKIGVYKVSNIDYQSMDQSTVSEISTLIFNKFNLNKLKLIIEKSCSQRRSFTLRLKLDPGYYVIVPSSEQNDQVNFLLRFFTEYLVGDFNRDDKNKTDKLDINKPNQKEGFVWKDEWNDDNYNPWKEDNQEDIKEDKIKTSINEENEFGRSEDNFDDEVYDCTREEDINCENSSTKEKCSIM